MLNVQIKGQGIAILCLHGHPGSSASLNVFTDNLSQQYQTFAPDLRGYGQSKSQGRFKITDHLGDLEEILDHYQIRSCYLLGWSLGGILALELALRNPERYLGLIMIASAARPWGNHPRTSLTELIATLIAATINYWQPGKEWNIKTFGQRSLLSYLFCQQTPQAYQYLAKDGTRAYLQTSLDAHLALNAALSSGYNRLQELSTLEIPCLVLGGEKDCHITWASSLETAQRLKNCQWHCYANTAHLFPWEVPEQVLGDINRWLARLGA